MKKEILKALFLKYRLFIYPVLVGLASLVLIILVIFPNLKGFLTSHQNLQSVSLRLETLTTKVSALEGLNEGDLRSKVELVLQALPTDKDLAQVVGILQTLIGRSGLSLTTLTIGQSQAAPSGVSGYSVKMEVTGTKEALPIFMDNIEKNPRAMKISSIEISTARADLVSAVLTIDIFYSPAPTTLGAVDVALPKLTGDEEKIIADLARVIPASPGTPRAPTLPPRGRANPFE